MDGVISIFMTNRSYIDIKHIQYFLPPKMLSVMQVARYVEGGWIQRFKPTTYRFPDPDKALADAIEAAGPTLGPTLLSMSEFLMSSFNESYQSRCVNPNFLHPTLVI